jgi:DNA primase
MSNTVEALLQDKHLVYTTSGKDYVIHCLNPEHIDDNPSLRIHKISGLGHCFSCGYKLNIFKHFNIIHNFQSTKVLEIQDKINRIISDTVGLEFPKEYSAFTNSFRGISAQTLLRYEAFTHKDFEDRIVFPLRDITGKIKAFIGRLLYSNFGQRYDIKPAGITLPIFPYDYKPKNGEIILVEGIFDALNLIDNGFTNVVALMGVNGLSEKNYRNRIAQFKLRGVSKILLMLDNDEAGQKQTKNIQEWLITENILGDTIELPREDSDPGDLTSDEIYQLKKALKYENSSNRQTAE